MTLKQITKSWKVNSLHECAAKKQSLYVLHVENFSGWRHRRRRCPKRKEFTAEIAENAEKSRNSFLALTSDRGFSHFFHDASLFQQRIQFRHHLKRISHIQYVRFAPRPPAIRIEIHRPPFLNESPADDVRLLAMTASGQSFRMPRG